MGITLHNTPLDYLVIGRVLRFSSFALCMHFWMSPAMCLNAGMCRLVIDTSCVSFSGTSKVCVIWWYEQAVYRCYQRVPPGSNILFVMAPFQVSPEHRALAASAAKHVLVFSGHVVRYACYIHVSSRCCRLCQRMWESDTDASVYMVM